MKKFTEPHFYLKSLLKAQNFPMETMVWVMMVAVEVPLFCQKVIRLLESQHPTSSQLLSLVNTELEIAYSDYQKG